MFNKIQNRRRQQGFTLIELLIVVAIIGIIAVILIPNLLDALQKAKQKSTTADMREVMQAFFSYTTDQVGAAAAGAPRTFDLGDVATGTTTITDIRETLSPEDISEGAVRYIQTVPENDGWGTPYEYWVSTNLLGTYGFAIRSFGKDGAEGCDADYPNYCGENAYQIGAFISTEYEQDIVGVDGYFVRWPAGLQSIEGAP